VTAKRLLAGDGSHSDPSPHAGTTAQVSEAPSKNGEVSEGIDERILPTSGAGARAGASGVGLTVSVPKVYWFGYICAT
jgi:hypothetical protein